MANKKINNLKKRALIESHIIQLNKVKNIIDTIYIIKKVR